ncbi:hypothetical protein KM043_011130 [Ampulex compressa]|nr:hypothetical protein KM043_011130 [Ampulex compressa]
MARPAPVTDDSTKGVHAPANNASALSLPWNCSAPRGNSFREAPNGVCFFPLPEREANGGSSNPRNKDSSSRRNERARWQFFMSAPTATRQLGWKGTIFPEARA